MSENGDFALRVAWGTNAFLNPSARFENEEGGEDAGEVEGLSDNKDEYEEVGDDWLDPGGDSSNQDIN